MPLYTYQKNHLLNCYEYILRTIYKPKATEGPTPKANNNVPIPTVPPKYHPILTTDISRKALTKAIGKFVFFVNQSLDHLLDLGLD